MDESESAHPMQIRTFAIYQIWFLNQIVIRLQNVLLRNEFCCKAILAFKHHTASCHLLGQLGSDFGDDGFLLGNAFALSLASGGFGVNQFTSLNNRNLKTTSSRRVSGWDHFNVFAKLTVKRYCEGITVTLKTNLC